MAKYDISRQATEDLYAIWEYTYDTWSENQADKYYSVLEAAMEEIGSAPLNIGKQFNLE
jgi:toxin ParE1/3/4